MVARENVIRAYKEIWATRSNDPNMGAEVLIMQRQAENDLSGYWLESYDDVIHYCVPAEFDGSRRCRTVLGWSDPREEDGQSYWPARFTSVYWAKKKIELGPYAWAGQFQQIPAPRGGGIIKSEWWRVWPPEEDADAWQRETRDEDGNSKLVTIFPEW